VRWVHKSNGKLYWFNLSAREGLHHLMLESAVAPFLPEVPSANALLHSAKLIGEPASWGYTAYLLGRPQQ